MITHSEICKLNLLEDVTGILLIQKSVAVSPVDIPPSRDGSDILLLLQGMYVVSARPYHGSGISTGQISLSDAQRTWMGIALTDVVNVELYDPFSNGGQAYLGAMDMEIGFASQRKQEQRPYDQDELAKVVTQVCRTYMVSRRT